MVSRTFEGARQRLARDGTLLHGRTSHSEGIALLSQYDFLLLLLADLPNSRAVMSIKLPHYLLVGRPIIAVVPEQSAVADVVRETGTGVVIAAESDWADQLQSVLRSRCGSSRPPETKRRSSASRGSTSRANGSARFNPPAPTSLARARSEVSDVLVWQPSAIHFGCACTGPEWIAGHPRTASIGAGLLGRAFAQRRRGLESSAVWCTG